MENQQPRRREGFPTNNYQFGGSQQFNSYDSLYHTGPGPQTSYDASWGVNASNNPPPQSQSHHSSTQVWSPHANHLSPTPTGHDVQASPYARSLSNSPAPYALAHAQHAFNSYGTQQPNIQYRQQPQYDPALVAPQQLNRSLNGYSPTIYQTGNAGTIAPHALQQDTRSPAFGGRFPYDVSEQQANKLRPMKPNLSDNVDQRALVGAMPKGKLAGYFSVINYDDLSKATKSVRMSEFVNIGSEAGQWDINRAALPIYVARKSRNDLRKVAGNDAKILKKLGKKLVKAPKGSIIAPRSGQSLSSNGAVPAEKIRYEGDSSSAEDSSSDEDDGSSYTSDDANEPAPLPSKRPTMPKEATEYDTIKALWRTKRRRPNSESIRKGLVDFWEIVKTIRDRWKVDANAVTEAEAKKRENELPLLRSRVKDQRDMIEVAFKTALKHGHRDITELFSQNASLLFLCYQFLLDRAKEEEYNGTLARAILDVICLSTTIKEDTYEKTHLSKVIPRYIKRGDAKTQYYAKRIAASVSASTTETPAAADTKTAATKPAVAGSPIAKKPEPEPVAGVKRPASTAGDARVQKKVATTASKLNGTAATKPLGTGVRKPATSDAAKPTAAAPATAVKAKQVTAKPSGLFASLQSASKRPGTSNANRVGSGAMAASSMSDRSSAGSAQSTAPKSTFSFTETMANLSKPKEEKPVPKPVPQIPNETPEEKTRRLRKESRRHLHVTFKRDDELTEVRIFHHDPDEELGHDASQMRDVSDVGGEGRMLKLQHQMMDVDEEEELPPAQEEKLVDFKEPTDIDFNLGGEFEEERKRNFAPYGGGQLEPESEERKTREHYEANNLMVVYAQPADIPPNPREPADPYNGEERKSFTKFAPPEDKYAARARQMKVKGRGFAAPQQNATQQPLDLSKLAGFLNTAQFPQQPVVQQPQQPAAPPAFNSDALSSLLASLNSNNNTATPPMPMNNYPAPYAPPPPPAMNPAQPTLPSGQPDLAAILAQITANQNPAATAMAGGAYGYAAQQQQQQQPQQQPQGVYENPERKQWRETGGGSAVEYGGHQAQGPGQVQTVKDVDKKGNRYYKTKTCKYWLEGKCQKGEMCTYKHEE